MGQSRRIDDAHRESASPPITSELLHGSEATLSATTDIRRPYLGECRGQHLGWPNLLLRDKLPDRQQTGGPGHGYRWQRRILIRTGGELGEAPARLVVQG